MFAKKLFILISGHAGVGKSTLAEILYNIYKDRGANVEVSPLAKKLKEIAYDGGWDCVKDEKGRKLLVDIGRVFREYDIDTWVKFAINRPSDVVIIDDWRYPNELAFIKKNPNYSVVEVRVVCKERETLKGEAYMDDSETSLDSYNVQTEIHNTGDMYSLWKSAEALEVHIDRKFKKW